MAVWQPAFGLQDRLPRPRRQRLGRLPLVSAQRDEGARIVRKGRAQVRLAQGIGTAIISDSQRRPLVLTKCPLEDRTGSR